MAPLDVPVGPVRRCLSAGHRCPTCFCLTSLCRCRRERVISCLCSGPGGHTARSHQGPAHISLCASQVVAFFFHFRLAPLLVSCATMSVRNPAPTPPGWQHPHPCQWQVLYRSYSRRQRRLSRRTRESRPLPLAVAQSVFHSVCNWLHIRSPLAAMNPHRPGGRPRQHYRPDGSRRRTAGELAKRAAKAAARAAAAAAGAAGGGAAKPAGPVVADAGVSAGVLVPQGSCQPRHQLQPRLLLQPRPRQLHLDLHMAPTPIECSTRHPALQLALWLGRRTARDGDMNHAAPSM